MQFLAQVLHGYSALVDLREIVPRRLEVFSDPDSDMCDQDAMLLPQLVDLLLATVEEVVEVVDEQHALPRCVRCTAATEEDIVSTLGGREELLEMPFGHDFEARKL